MAALAKALQDRRLAITACIAAGVFPLTHWLVAHSSRGETSQQPEWFFVLRFSAVLLAMGIGMLAIASQVASPAATRTAVVLGVILTAASLTNIVEDRFHVGPACLVFVAELVFLLVGCLAPALFILAGERGSVRLWAAVPIATVGGIMLYVELRGPVLAIAWIGAARVVRAAPTELRMTQTPHSHRGMSVRSAGSRSAPRLESP